MNFVSMIFYFYVIFSVEIFHLNILKQIPLNHNKLYFHKMIFHNKLTISLNYYYHVLFYINLLLFLTNKLVRNQDFLKYLLYFSIKISFIFVFFCLLRLIKLYVIYYDHHFRILDIHLHIWKIF